MRLAEEVRKAEEARLVKEVRLAEEAQKAEAARVAKELAAAKDENTTARTKLRALADEGLTLNVNVETAQELLGNPLSEGTGMEAIRVNTIQINTEMAKLQQAIIEGKKAAKARKAEEARRAAEARKAKDALLAAAEAEEVLATIDPASDGEFAAILTRLAEMSVCYLSGTTKRGYACTNVGIVNWKKEFDDFIKHKFDTSDRECDTSPQCKELSKLGAYITVDAKNAANGVFGKIYYYEIKLKDKFKLTPKANKFLVQRIPHAQATRL
jgi:hypothetical protein